MKLNLLIACFCLLGFCAGYSQQGGTNLKFIAANPDMHLDSEVYLSFLYALNADSLVVQDTLTGGNKMCSRFVRVYHDLGLAIYFEEDILNVDNNSLKLFDFKEGGEKVQTTRLERKINPWPNLVLKENIPHFGLFENILKDTIEYHGINKNLEVIELSPKDFGESYIVGYPGSPLKNMDYQLVVSNESNGDLRIPLTRNVLGRPIFPIALPEDFWLQKKTRVKIYIHTDKMLVLKLSQSRNRSEGVGESLFAIYNKNQGDWAELRVPGNRTRIQAFGNWVSGSVVEKDPGQNRISKGVKVRKDSPDIYGPGFDVMTKVLKLYYPGNLFLYNIQNNKYIEWTTGQCDSEVLLVQGNVVIYRIDDSIFRARIIDEEAIGDSQLLIKDPRVRDIHWAIHP